MGQTPVQTVARRALKRRTAKKGMGQMITSWQVAMLKRSARVRYPAAAGAKNLSIGIVSMGDWAVRMSGSAHEGCVEAQCNASSY